MKKTFVTLATVAALVAAAAPAATTFANNTYNPQSQKANALVVELGREYALKFADAAAAKTNVENAAANVLAAENNLATVVANGQAAVVAVDTEIAKVKEAVNQAKTAWENASAAVVALQKAGDTEGMTEAQALVDETFAGYQSALDLANTELARLEAKLEDTKAQVAKDTAAAEKIVADAKKELADAQAVLAEAVAAKEAAYNKAINAGLTPEQVKQAEESVTVPSNTAAKPAAKTVAAAKTGTGAKTLPKTSAAK